MLKKSSRKCPKTTRIIKDPFKVSIYVFLFFCNSIILNNPIYKILQLSKRKVTLIFSLTTLKKSPKEIGIDRRKLNVLYPQETYHPMF